MDTKDVILELRTKKGLSQDELAEKLYVTSRKTLCYKASGIPLGKRRNNSEYRNLKTALQVFRCFNQYAFRLPKTAYLPMLRYIE